MALLTTTSGFQYGVEWSIRHFQLCSSWGDHVVITSPQFDIRLLEKVTLKFSLQSQGGPENGMLFTVHSDETRGFKAQCSSLSLVVYVPSGKEYRSLSEPTTPKKKPLIPSAESFLLLDDVYPGMPLDGGTLGLGVTINTTVDQVDYWSNLFDPHMVALSNDLDSMVTWPLYVDKVMVSEESVKSHVHSCILRARMPVLFKSETSNSVPDAGSSDSCESMDVDFETCLPTEALRTLIFYLYGKLAFAIPENQIKELQKFAHKYELEYLKSVLKWYPSQYSLRTRLYTEDMTLNFYVDDMIKQKNGINKLFPDSRNTLNPHDLNLFWQFKPDESLAFAFVLDSHPTQFPFHLKCTVELKNNVYRVMKQRVSRHTFTKRKPWSFPEFITKSLMDELRPYMITCRIKITESQFEDKGWKGWTPKTPRGDVLLAFNNIQALGDQLRDLSLGQVGCDLGLRFGSRVFHVHKAIAVARSPKIRQKVREEKGKDVKMITLEEPSQEVEVEHYEAVIKYMYSGRIEQRSQEFMKNVATLADYLDMHVLAQHCLRLSRVL